MNIKSIVFLSIVSMMAACTTAPVESNPYDREVSEFRTFLSNLDRHMNDISFSGADSSMTFDILRIRDDLYRVMGNSRSFAEFTFTDYEEFRSLSKELYRRMCSEQRFVGDRAYLHDMLVTPDFDRQVAGLQ